MTFIEASDAIGHVEKKAKRVLAGRLRATGATCDEKGYVDAPEGNVLCRDSWKFIEPDLKNGAGDELRISEEGRPAKFCAAHSSSALAVNTFGTWRQEPDGLSIAGLSRFTSLQFEQRCGAGVRGTAPHLDVLAMTPDTVLAIESKCMEYLRPKVAQFAEAYQEIEGVRRDSSWFQFVTDIELRNRFAHLDVGQLVKHYLGLANTFTSGRVVLLYLFWEPVNAGDFEVFGEHRRELHEFARVVAGDRIEFAYQSYPELWCQWEALEVHVTQRQYFERLRARYLVRV